MPSIKTQAALSNALCKMEALPEWARSHSQAAIDIQHEIDTLTKRLAMELDDDARVPAAILAAAVATCCVSVQVKPRKSKRIPRINSGHRNKERVGS